MRKHRIIINLLIIFCIVMMLPPIMLKATKPVIVFGVLPMFAAWIFGWSLFIVILLILLFILDESYEKKHK